MGPFAGFDALQVVMRVARPIEGKILTSAPGRQRLT